MACIRTALVATPMGYDTASWALDEANRCSQFNIPTIIKCKPTTVTDTHYMRSSTYHETLSVLREYTNGCLIVDVSEFRIGKNIDTALAHVNDLLEYAGQNSVQISLSSDMEDTIPDLYRLARAVAETHPFIGVVMALSNYNTETYAAKCLRNNIHVYLQVSQDDKDVKTTIARIFAAGRRLSTLYLIFTEGIPCKKLLDYIHRKQGSIGVVVVPDKLHFAIRQSNKNVTCKVLLEFGERFNPHNMTRSLNGIKNILTTCNSLFNGT